MFCELEIFTYHVCVTPQLTMPIIQTLIRTFFTNV